MSLWQRDTACRRCRVKMSVTSRHPTDASATTRTTSVSGRRRPERTRPGVHVLARGGFERWIAAVVELLPQVFPFGAAPSTEIDRATKADLEHAQTHRCPRRMSLMACNLGLHKCQLC